MPFVDRRITPKFEFAGYRAGKSRSLGVLLTYSHGKLCPWPCQLRWREAVTRLAFLHPPYIEVGLRHFGKTIRDYPELHGRQVKKLCKMAQAQASVMNIIHSGKCGEIPHIDKLLSFLATRQPLDRASFTDGNYKIHNVGCHEAELQIVKMLD